MDDDVGMGRGEGRIYRHGGGMSSDDEEEEVGWGGGGGGEHSFVTGSGQKVAIDTSGLGEEGEGSREFDNSGWQ